MICDAPPPSSETAQAGQVNLFIGAGAVAMSVCAGDLIGPRTLAVRDRGCAPPAEAEHRTTPVVILDANDHPVETVVDQDTRGAHCLRESASLHDALDLMIHHHERFVPLVNADGSLVGLLTDLDVLRWVARATRGTH